jgi:hypothetical protein
MGQLKQLSTHSGTAENTFLTTLVQKDPKQNPGAHHNQIPGRNDAFLLLPAIVHQIPALLPPGQMEGVERGAAEAAFYASRNRPKSDRNKRSYIQDVPRTFLQYLVYDSQPPSTKEIRSRSREPTTIKWLAQMMNSGSPSLQLTPCSSLSMSLTCFTNHTIIYSILVTTLLPNHPGPKG